MRQAVEGVGERRGGALAGGDAGCAAVGGGVLGDEEHADGELGEGVSDGVGQCWS